jgi:UDP-GlcNAc:undecaprenyl-phosphate GlcNAc-1-phosphate transferase
MTTNYFLIILLSTYLAGVVFIFLLKKFALKFKLLVHRGMPLIGGMSIGLSFGLIYFLGSVSRGFLSRETLGIIFSSGIMLIFGIVDDLRELTIANKFLVQIIAISLLIFFGIRTKIVYIGDTLNIIITFIWMLGITNAFNHLDILDGLAAGIAAIVSLALFIICIINSDFATAILALALTGAALSFLSYNLPPARIYMGNSGSHFLGFVLAATALVISYAPMQRKIALLSPLLVLGFPVFDTAFLILMRIIKKSLPFKKSNDHLVLKFMALGYSKKKSLSIMLILTLFFSSCGILVSQVSNLFGAAIVFFVALVSVFVINKMSRVIVYD